MTAEAILLHYLDNLDAKMQTVRNELKRAEANGRSGDEMTEWVRPLERQLLNTAAYLKSAETGANAAGPSVVEKAGAGSERSGLDKAGLDMSGVDNGNRKEHEEKNHALPFED
jgi:hypothetical protein